MEQADETTRLLNGQSSNTRYVSSNSSRNTDASAVDDVTIESSEGRFDDETITQHGSAVTIFSFWNMLMGTSLLTMPWAFQSAGLAQGICIQILMCGVAVYTACLLLKAGQQLADPITKEMPEFMDICRSLIGRWAAWLNVLASAVILGGALIVYWILMVELLYNSVISLYYYISPGGSQPEPNTTYSSTAGMLTSDRCTLVEGLPNRPKVLPIKGWNEHVTAPLIFIPLFLPILQLRRVTFFARLGAFGTLSVLFLIAVVIVKCSIWGINVNFNDPNSHSYVPQFLGSFPSLSGLLGMGYFIHNSVTTFFKHNKHQQNNIRDLQIGYFLVFITYLLIGLGIYLTFPLKKHCIAQNFLENLSLDDALSLAAQLTLFFRMVTVYPMVAFILRVQVFIAMFGKEYPGKFHVALFNVVIVTSCVLCAIFYPNIGDIIRYAGAFCAMALMFVLPCVCYVIMQRRSGNLTLTSFSVHVIISILGIVNFIAQFTVKG